MHTLIFCLEESLVVFPRILGKSFGIYLRITVFVHIYYAKMAPRKVESMRAQWSRDRSKVTSRKG